MEEGIKVKVSEVLTKLDHRTTPSLPLDCCCHGAQGLCSGEKESAESLIKKPNPSLLLSHNVYPHKHSECIHTTSGVNSFRNHTE